MLLVENVMALSDHIASAFVLKNVASVYDDEAM